MYTLFNSEPPSQIRLMLPTKQMHFIRDILILIYADMYINEYCICNITAFSK